MASAHRKIQLLLAETIVQEYEKEAQSKGLTLEALLVERLIRCRAHRASRSLYFNDESRQELEKLLGGLMLRTSSEALQRIRNVLSMVLETGESQILVIVPPRVFSRLRTRLRGRPLEKALKEETVLGLEYQVGLR